MKIIQLFGIQLHLQQVQATHLGKRAELLPTQSVGLGTRLRATRRTRGLSIENLTDELG